ncbi:MULTISPECIES: urea transporter [Micromonospora]|uniref:Urea transporter n=1 Tax=Micromonospora maris TaxID=1003110 RepID=A0A9X0IA04_9ACTN|nr:MULTISPECIES: urea transporter [Micromonospora]KUJ49616.1 urea transporter [Micromonospora maris]RUL91930.1 urea transporter [Verrucosispora sp. FIM060022]
MTAIARRWDGLADHNPLVQFIDACLRGPAQVVFQNNPLTGVVILLAVAWGAFDSGHPRIFGGGVLGLVVGTATALALQVDRASWRKGLFGFSPFLTGIAVPTFLDQRPLMWLYLVLGAAGTTVVTLALNAVFKRWGLTAFTFPFVLTTWVLLLAAYQFERFTVLTQLTPKFPGEGTLTGGHFNWDLVPIFLRGISQVFLINSWVSGLLIIIALLINSRWSAVFAIVGAVGATLLALWFGADGTSLDKGLFGFNAVLTAIAVGAVLHRPGLLVTGYTLFGIALTLFIQMAMASVLTPLGIPVLTGPFNVATWLLLLPDRHFAPVPNHERVKETVVSSVRRSV